MRSSETVYELFVPGKLLWKAFKWLIENFSKGSFLFTAMETFQKRFIFNQKLAIFADSVTLADQWDENIHYLLNNLSLRYPSRSLMT